MASIIRQEKVSWILNCSVRDIGFRTALKDLNEQEIRHCLGIEKRVSAIEALRREAKRKGIKIDDDQVVECSGCGWKWNPKPGWRATVCPRCCQWINCEGETAQRA